MHYFIAGPLPNAFAHMHVGLLCLHHPYNVHRKTLSQRPMTSRLWRCQPSSVTTMAKVIARGTIKMQQWQSQLSGVKEQAECRPILLVFRSFKVKILFETMLELEFEPGEAYLAWNKCPKPGGNGRQCCRSPSQIRRSSHCCQQHMANLHMSDVIRENLSHGRIT